jgi:hypothetical protein
MMQRYNRGFLKFGPLEKCDKGELVFYKDALDILLDLEKEIFSLQQECLRKDETIKWMGSRINIYKDNIAKSIISRANTRKAHKRKLTILTFIMFILLIL